MKKIFIILLSIVSIVACAQDEPLTDLTPATDPDGNDLLYFVEDGSSTSITKDLLQESVTDSLADHLAKIEALEAGGGDTFDSTSVTYTTDTIHGLDGTIPNIHFNRDFTHTVGMYYDDGTSDARIELSSLARLKSVGADSDAELTVTRGGVTIQYDSIGYPAGKTLVINENYMLAWDGISEKGLEYFADYSANGILDPLWIPSWGAVTTAIAAGGGGDTAALWQVAPLHRDTVPEFVFGYGMGVRASDSLDCVVGAEIGAFITGPTDSVSCVSFNGFVTAGEGSPTVTVQFFYGDNSNDPSPTAITNPTAITSPASGVIIATFVNQTIPPNVWVWGKITAVSEGNKPILLRVALLRYKRTGE